MYQQGKSEADISMVLSQRDKGSNRPRYVEMTVRNARSAVECSRKSVVDPRGFQKAITQFISA